METRNSLIIGSHLLSSPCKSAQGRMALSLAFPCVPALRALSQDTPHPCILCHADGTAGTGTCGTAGANGTLLRAKLSSVRTILARPWPATVSSFSSLDCRRDRIAPARPVLASYLITTRTAFDASPFTVIPTLAEPVPRNSLGRSTWTISTPSEAAEWPA